MHPDLPILRESPFDQAAFDRLVQSARGGNPFALDAWHELARMPELKQRAVSLLAELKELDHLARWWAAERDPIVGRVLAQHGFVADYRQGMRVDSALRVTVLTALNASRSHELWELPERLRAMVVQPLIEACADPELGAEAARAVHDCPWFELLVEEALRAGCAAEGRRQVVLDRRWPQDPGRRALLHLLRDQPDEAALLDPDGSLLALACQGSDDALRLEVLSRLRQQGRTLQALELLGARSRRGLDEIVSALLVEGRLPELWDLVFHLPPEQAGELLARLHQAEFVPEEEELFRELIALLPYERPEPLRLAGEVSLLGPLVLRATPGHLEALRPTDGRLKWALDLEGRGHPMLPHFVGSYDGSVLAVAAAWRTGDEPTLYSSERSRYRFYDSQSGLERHDFQDRGARVLALSPDGALLAQADASRVSLSNGKSWELAGVTDLAFAPGSLGALTSSGPVQLRSDSNLPPQHFPNLGLTGCEPPWAFSGPHAAASTRTHVLLTGREPALFPGRFWELGFDGDERLLMVARTGVWREGSTLRSFSEPARAATLSPDRRRLAFVQGQELWVEDLTDRRRALQLSIPPDTRRLEYGAGLILAQAREEALIWPTAWSYGPDQLEKLGAPYRFAYLQARHRHRHAIELDGVVDFDPADIELG